MKRVVPVAGAREVYLLLLVLLVAFGLRLWDLNAPSVWHDEGWSIRAIRDPIHTPDDNTPPVYYAALHMLWLAAGEAPLALRYGSLLLDLLTIALAVQLVRARAGQDAGLLLALLLAFTPLLWAYAREIRAYVAVPLLAVVLLALADRLLATRQYFRWRVWGVLLLAELLLLYTHNLSVPVIAWLNLVMSLAYVYRRAWRALGIWVAGQAALLLVYLPWVLSQSPSGTPLNTPPRLSLGLAWDVWQGYFAPLPVMIGAEDLLVVGSATYAMVFALSVVAVLVWQRTRFALLVLSQAVLLPLLATFLLLAANIDFHPRYYVAGVPAALMLVALAATQARRARAVVMLAVLGVGIGTGAGAIERLINDPRYQHDDFRAIAEYYATLPESALIVIPYGWEPALDVYYADRFNVRAEILGIDLHSEAAAAREMLNAALAAREWPVHVELLNWFQLPADLRGMYPCLLSSAGQRVGERVVQGIATTAYRVERPIAFTALDAPPVANDQATLVHAAAGGAPALCVQTDWRLERALDSDLRVSARLLTTTPPGWAVARSDTDVRSVMQEPTSGLARDDMASAFSLLKLPAGAPPGEYMLRLVVFSVQQPHGLDWAVSGVPVGRYVQLATLPLDGNTRQPFAEEPPQAINVPVTEAITLHGLDAGPEVLSAGQELRITLYWTAEDCCRQEAWSEGTLALVGDGWRVARPVSVYGPYSLDWHALRVPAGAAGDAALTLDVPGMDSVALAAYSIEAADHMFAPPAFDVPVDTVFGDLAVLAGFSVEQRTLAPGEPLDLTLVWRVLETPGTSYRVFTHLLNDAGRVIAQHDGYPVNGERPTTGWVAGEYIADPYRLTFDPDYADYRGPARLEVGFYDPETGVRVLTANGADHVVLPVEIRVQ